MIGSAIRLPILLSILVSAGCSGDPTAAAGALGLRPGAGKPGPSTPPKASDKDKLGKQTSGKPTAPTAKAGKPGAGDDRPPAGPGTRVRIDGLAQRTTPGSLIAAFEQFGAVSDAKVARDSSTGRSRGFGYVVFASPEQARAAIASLHGAKIDGQAVSVTEDENAAAPDDESATPPVPVKGPKSHEVAPRRH